MVRLYLLKSRPRKNNMSFKSAMRGTQVNQSYRQNNAQLQNIDRDMRDDRFAFNDKENKRGNMIEAFGSAVKGVGTLGGELTNMDKNIQFGKKHGLESGGLINMINPFKKGGFGQTYSKGDGPNMTNDDLGQTRSAMDWSQARMGPDAFSFGDASEMMMSDNPMQTLLGRYNSWKGQGVKEKIADSAPESKPQHQASSMDGQDGYARFLLDEKYKKKFGTNNNTDSSNQIYGNRFGVMGEQ